MAELLGRYSRFDPFKKRVGRIGAALRETQDRPAQPEMRPPQALARRLGHAWVEQLIQDYESGDGCTVLAHRYSVSENGVIRQLRRAGVTIRPRGKVSADDVELMRKLRTDGQTYAAIGRQFGVTRSAVKLRLDR